MPHGWPKKRLRNISRLHGQAAAPHATQIGDKSRTVDDSDQHDSESDEHFEDNLAVALDGLKFNFKKVYGDTDDDVSDIDEEIELGILEDKEFGKKLAEMIEREDGKDPEWIPERLWRKKKRSNKQQVDVSVWHLRNQILLISMKPAHLKIYQKGPDVMSKSEHT